MKIDLTFLGVALKPIITNVEFIDYISEKRAEVTLGVTVEQADDFEYLKTRGFSNTNNHRTIKTPANKGFGVMAALRINPHRYNIAQLHINLTNKAKL